MTVQSAAFNSKEVARILGVPAGTLQSWIRPDREAIMDGQGPGRGKVREFNAYDVASLCLVKKLLDRSFPLADALKMASSIKDLWSGCPRGAENHQYNWIVITPKSAWPTARLSPDFRSAEYAGKSIVDAPGSCLLLHELLAALGGGMFFAFNTGAFLRETLSGIAKLGLPGANLMIESRVA